MATAIQKWMHDKLGVHFYEHLPVIKIRQYKTSSMTWTATSVHSYRCKYCGTTFETNIYAGEKIRLR